MSKDGHYFSPGPWATYENSDGQFSIVATTLLGNERNVAECDGDYPDPVIGNARLIAAAPDLLRACEVAVEASGDCHCGACDILKAAIHLARGDE